MPKKVDPQLKARAVRLATEHRDEDPTLTAASQADKCTTGRFRAFSKSVLTRRGLLRLGAPVSLSGQSGLYRGFECEPVLAGGPASQPSTVGAHPCGVEALPVTDVVEAAQQGVEAGAGRPAARECGAGLFKEGGDGCHSGSSTTLASDADRRHRGAVDHSGEEEPHMTKGQRDAGNRSALSVVCTGW